MDPQLIDPTNESSAAASSGTPTLEDAARALVDSIPNRAGPESAVHLDVTLSGVRYLVTVAEAEAAPISNLSPREREIVRMVSLGYTNKMVAAVLEISLWTVSTHLRRIFAKLGVSTRAAMVARAANHLGSTGEQVGAGGLDRDS